MNLLFPVLIITAAVISFIGETAAEASTALIAGAADAMTLVLTLGGNMAFWNGMMTIAESCGITRLLQKLFSPILRLIFGVLPAKSKEQIAINLSANLLGLGNAATPSGLKAMELLDTEAAEEQRTLFVILNSCSLQLIPTSVAAVRLAAGSSSPFDITLPILFSSAVSLVTAVMLAKIIFYIKRR